MPGVLKTLEEDGLSSRKSGECGVVPWCLPVLRWAGSKRKLLPKLQAMIQSVNFRRYVEPFAGSACLFFAAKPRSAVLADKNKELMHFYGILKDHPRLLFRAISGYDENGEDYYTLRETSPSEMCSISRAARFLYLNRFCFNGIYRENKSGIFNVPRGNRTGNLPSAAHLYRAHIALRSAELISSDFLQACSVTRGSLYYLDPPYDYSGRLDRGEYGPETFARADMPRLFTFLENIQSIDAKFILSYISTKEIEEFAKGKTVVRVPVKRQIASFCRFRTEIKELIITNL